MKILLVDDKTSIRTAMRKILVDLGMKDITEVIDGEEAWHEVNNACKKGEDAVYDLIICDMEMPKMTGLELLRAVRNSDVLKRTPFIMATTVTAKQIIIETMQLGVQAYIIKPFDAPMVELKLKQAGIL